jgi:hypothetical protein
LQNIEFSGVVEFQIVWLKILIERFSLLDIGSLSGTPRLSLIRSLKMRKPGAKLSTGVEYQGVKCSVQTDRIECNDPDIGLNQDVVLFKWPTRRDDCFIVS